MSKKHILGIIAFVLVTSLRATPVDASRGCSPVYGGGHVCPTATPQPTATPTAGPTSTPTPTGKVTTPSDLPKAGAEVFLIPAAGSILTGGLYLIKKSKEFSK